MKIIRLIAILAVLLFVTKTAMAADYFVRAGATGANNGADWTNAYTSLPGTLVRGATYYIADGTYGSYSFDDAQSGATYIYIKKATTTNHGTDIGWSNSYGDGAATFTSWSFSTGYWDIDGQVGKWASDLNGYEAYGFVITQTASSSGTKLIYFPSPGASYYSIKHVEAYYGNTSSWPQTADIINGYASHITFDYCWFHDAGECVAIVVSKSYWTWDHSVLERSGRAQATMNFNPSEHSEMIAFHPSSSYGIVRNSYIRDWRSTGGFSLFTNAGNMEFYGNVFTTTGFYSIPGQANDSDGVINAQDTLGGYVHIYNNTFVNISYGCNIMTNGSNTKLVYNNIFYNCRRYNDGSGGGAVIAGTHDYNWIYGSDPQSETHIQNGTGSPFVNLSGKNYHLSSATNAGNNTMGVTYNTALDGTTRGQDGTWDRGAFEFVSTIYSAIPSAPSNLRIIQ